MSGDTIPPKRFDMRVLALSKVFDRRGIWTFGACDSLRRWCSVSPREENRYVGAGYFGFVRFLVLLKAMFSPCGWPDIGNVGKVPDQRNGRFPT